MVNEMKKHVETLTKTSFVFLLKSSKWQQEMSVQNFKCLSMK